MAVTSKDQVSGCAPKQKEPKRTKDPGVRVIRGIIYDSENGKTCHQCRQKTRVFSAACKNQKGDKQCTISFCHKCLSNRYGEKAEEVALLDNWKCPKCRGICNCSQCMKKRGHKPTGQLAHAAKATGFSSVSEMLQIRGLDNLSNEKEFAEDTIASLNRSLSPEKESTADISKKQGKENSFDKNCDSNLKPILKDRISKKMKREGLKEICNSNEDVDISLRKEPPKEPKISNEITKKEKATTSGENSEKEKHKVCDGISRVKRSKISEGIINQEVKQNAKHSGHFAKKKKNKIQVLIEDSLNVVKNEIEQDANDENVSPPNGIENNNAGAGPKLKAVSKSCKAKKCTAEQNKEFAPEILLPEGANLTTIAGTEIAPEDVGHALQFIEFCAAFGEVLKLKKGEAESIIRELIRGKIRRRGQSCPIDQIHIQLLSFIKEDRREKSPSLSSTSGKNSWLQALGKCVSESKCPLDDIPSDCFESGGDGYYKLDCSKKLKLLTFLCDEALSTETLRNCIDDQNSKFVEREKEAKEMVVAARDKEKQLKQKLQDEVAQAIVAKNGAPLSVSEHEAIISEIKSKAAQAHSEMLEAMGMVPKTRQRSDAVRTAPILLEDNGRAFWRLKGYTGEPDVLLQDLQGNWDAGALNEKWLFYGADQKLEIEKYISSRPKRRRVEKVTDRPITGRGETDS